jgi:hypothetical protein
MAMGLRHDYAGATTHYFRQIRTSASRPSHTRCRTGQYRSARRSQPGGVLSRRCISGTGRAAAMAVWSRRPPARHWLCDPDLPGCAVSGVPASIAGVVAGRSGTAAGRPQVAAPGVPAGAYIRVCGNSTERRWNDRIFGLPITPSRISIARRMVWSRSQAPGPPITVLRCGISASLISQVAEFHR